MSCFQVNTMDKVPQASVVEFMARAGSYPSACEASKRSPDSEQVEIITTHSAYIFLFGNDVYKIKRAVKYTYLDMSTLETRHKLCQREFELNWSQLPDIYLDVVPITSNREGGLQIGGQGEPVEWAVHMVRFPQACVLDTVADNGKLDVGLASDIGQSVAQYHGLLPTEAETDGHERIAEVVEELVVELNLLKAIFPYPTLKKLEIKLRAELADCEKLLNHRAAAGWVKRCHGDLHLRNLVLHHQIPTPFDALEFNERMATTDVLYDVAFLIMDLMHRGLLEQANAVLNQYLLYSSDDQLTGLRLLPLFLSCRAAIRAMTTAQASISDDSVSRSSGTGSGSGSGSGAGAGAGAGKTATAYLDLALQCLERTTPQLIAIGGLSGTGKSTLAKRLAPELGRVPGAVLLRSDAERKVSMGVNEITRLPDSHYSAASSSANYDLLLHKVGMALDAGRSVIVDAVFLDSEQRHAIEQCALSRKRAYVGIWLDAPIDVMRQRINSRANDASDATLAVLDKQLHAAKGGILWDLLDTSGTADEVLRDARRSINYQTMCEVVV